MSTRKTPREAFFRGPAGRPYALLPLVVGGQVAGTRRKEMPRGMSRPARTSAGDADKSLEGKTARLT